MKLKNWSFLKPGKLLVKTWIILEFLPFLNHSELLLFLLAHFGTPSISSWSMPPKRRTIPYSISHLFPILAITTEVTVSYSIPAICIYLPCISCMCYHIWMYKMISLLTKSESESSKVNVSYICTYIFRNIQKRRVEYMYLAIYIPLK